MPALAEKFGAALLDSACAAMSEAEGEDWEAMGEDERDEMREKLMPAHEVYMRALDEGGDEGQPAAGNGKEPRRKPAEMAAFMGRRGT